MRSALSADGGRAVGIEHRSGGRETNRGLRGRGRERRQAKAPRVRARHHLLAPDPLAEWSGAGAALTAGLVNLSGVSATADGRVLLAVAESQSGRLFHVPLDGTSPTPLTPSGADEVVTGYGGVAALPDGVILASRTEKGHILERWREGQAALVLGPDLPSEEFGLPAGSRDGHWLAFTVFGCLECRRERSLLHAQEGPLARQSGWLVAHADCGVRDPVCPCPGRAQIRLFRARRDWHSRRFGRPTAPSAGAPRECVAPSVERRWTGRRRDGTGLEAIFGIHKTDLVLVR